MPAISPARALKLTSRTTPSWLERFFTSSTRQNFFDQLIPRQLSVMWLTLHTDIFVCTVSPTSVLDFGNPVGQLKNFFHPVGDVQMAVPFSLIL